jgi:hypothetical protein
MRFFISRADDLMAIDNVAVTMDCSSLPESVIYVIWNEAGDGFVESNTGVALRTSFSDPSPYQPLIDDWMTAMAAATPALTVAQAQVVKVELVEALFEAYRIAPIAYSVAAAPGASWDASDEGVAALTLALFSALLAAFATLVGQTNTVIAAINAQLLNVAFVFNAASITVLWNGSSPSGGSQAMQSIAGFTNSVSISWTPIGATAPVALSATECIGLLAAIVARRASLQAARLTNEAAIDALNTVAAVIAFDVTAGW